MTDWITDLVETMGCAGIVLLMFLENVVPAHSLGSHRASLATASAPPTAIWSWLRSAFAGLAGTLAGALFWCAARAADRRTRLRRWADRHGRWITLSGDDIAKIGDMVLPPRQPGGPARASCTRASDADLDPGGGVRDAADALHHSLSTLGAGVWTGALGGGGAICSARVSRRRRKISRPWRGTAIMTALLLYYVWRVIRFKPGRPG